MAARTAATQLGYLLGAAVGGTLIAGAGYETLGFVLGACMAASALLVLRVDDPREGGAGAAAQLPASSGATVPATSSSWRGSSPSGHR
jgi:hypothetical protein